MEFASSVEVEASPDAAWTVIGERFGEIASWTNALDTSSLRGELGVGAERVCAGPAWGPFPAGEVTERLTEFDRSHRVLAYEGTGGLPWFLKSARNQWTVVALGPERCRVESKARLEFVFFLEPVFAVLGKIGGSRFMRSFLDELRKEILRVAS